MDDSHKPFEGSDGPRLHHADDGEVRVNFQPLRLLLQPGGLCVELNRTDMMIGRHSDADVRLGLPDISRRHCRFVFAEGCWQVIDLNSLNGTFVNGERLQEATLCHGDSVRIASLTFLVDIAEETNSPQPASADQGVLRSIADVLPERGPPTQPKRMAS